MPKNLYFAALSRKGFFRTIAALESVHKLGPFVRDSEDDWVYAHTILPGGARLNITRTSDTSTISTWMRTAPRKVNWQVILSHGNGLQGAQVCAVKLVLERRLGTELVLYDQN